MRGKGICKPICHWQIRITPAYAGKRGLPHGADFVFMGSPPPMRGKVIKLKVKYKYYGITPAYAGKSGRAVSDLV